MTALLPFYDGSFRPWEFDEDAFVFPGWDPGEHPAHPVFAHRWGAYPELTSRDLGSHLAGAVPVPSRPPLRLVPVDGNVYLEDGTGAVIGYYDGPTLGVHPAWRRIGLAAELVLATAFLRGAPPLAWFDEPGYSPGGLAAHRSAWRLACARAAALGLLKAPGPDSGPSREEPER